MRATSQALEPDEKQTLRRLDGAFIITVVLPYSGGHSVVKLPLGKVLIHPFNSSHYCETQLSCLRRSHKPSKMPKAPSD